MTAQSHARQAQGRTDRAAPKPPTGRGWPVLVVGLLGLNICVCFITITAATLNPARIEKDYYDKAINWDAHRGITDGPQAASPLPDDQAQEEPAP